jgi:hypothetical protein
MRSDPADRLRKWAPDADDYELPDLPEVVLTMIDLTLMTTSCLICLR